MILLLGGNICLFYFYYFCHDLTRAMLTMLIFQGVSAIVGFVSCQAYKFGKRKYTEWIASNIAKKNKEEPLKKYE